MASSLRATRCTVPSTALPASALLLWTFCLLPKCAGIGLEQREQACSFGLWNGINCILMAGSTSNTDDRYKL
jgi:hypothetical protein